jgi:plastocyanin
MGRCVVAGAVVVALGAFGGAPRPQAGTGTVAGRVTLTPRPSPLATSAYGRRDVAPKSAAGAPDTRKVVVYVSGVRPAAAPAPMRARIAQKDEQFHPQLTAVTVGSTIDFPNEDPFFHNVFSLSRAASFDLKRYRSGESRARVFSEPGVVKVFCHLHSHMNAVIVVFDHPWFVIPSEDGSFRLENVPAGEHTVVAWHERIGEVGEKLQIRPGAVANVAFTLPVLERK